MNPKRQRRPNVRLGEVGDVSAAFACGFSQKTKQILGFEAYKDDCMSADGTEQNPQQTPLEFLVPEAGVSPRISDDLLHNRENNNPNSSKSASDLVNWYEIDTTKSELNFGSIKRKCRVMKRRGRGSNSNYSVSGGVWSSDRSPRCGNGDGKDCGIKELVGFHNYECSESRSIPSFKDFSDQRTMSTSKEASESEMNGLTYDLRQHEGFDDCNGGSKVSPASGHAWEEMELGGDYANTVTKWLEEQGFGRYSGMFEMHEVDEEALPLLTFEDLKEMGVFAVGTRRKLYTAIQKLRSGEVSP